MDGSPDQMSSAAKACPAGGSSDKKPQLAHVDLIIVAIKGTVRHKESSGPLANVEVKVKGTGRSAVTDNQGRFRLGGLSTGSYTLEVRLSDGSQVEREIEVPDNEQTKKECDFDIEV
jgi:hypothetical protein